MSAMGIASLINGLYSGYDQEDRRQHDKALRDAERQTLPSRVERTRSQDQLITRRNQGGLALADAEQENAGKRLQYENAGLDSAISRQPIEAASQLNTANIQKVLSEHNVDDLPNVIAKQRVDRVFDNTHAQIAGIAKIADLMRIGDRKQVINFMNNMRKANPDIGLSGDVHDISVTHDKDSGDYVFSALDRTGNPLLQIPATQMQMVSDMVRPPSKEDYKALKPGQTLVRTRNGLAEPVYTAPESIKAQETKATPLEKNLNLLTSRFNMSEKEALAYLNTSKTVSREQFILKGMQDLIAIGRKPSEQDISNFAELYDSTRKSPETTSNSTDSSNIDPQIKALLGIP